MSAGWKLSVVGRFAAEQGPLPSAGRAPNSSVSSTTFTSSYSTPQFCRSTPSAAQPFVGVTSWALSTAHAD
ncbi:hypothetical protein STIAU_3633, partial [Stigmatella aurantiaca DW4/3-1]